MKDKSREGLTLPGNIEQENGCGERRPQQSSDGRGHSWQVSAWKSKLLASGGQSGGVGQHGGQPCMGR